ncbi:MULTISPECIES: hypothetical protein [Sphingobacterium]|uniref:hypothetical protein n=1 Tax=Sphingobacterium TaxID=28453 RepID=UPI001048AF1D|nr:MULTISPECIES: hypothetical protein [Sphingobacterium]MCW2259621.1 hypothetical protein [Sphingobacterium kitahiroshimense]TCR13937.1 hypothetical protein EDF67_10140 [Sphingobacterium sp. JUb78]
MKPFILQFKEAPLETNVDYSGISYDENLNLSIDIQTGLPAISALDLSTETLTKTNNESTDSDHNFVARLMGTESVTLVNNEATDSDRDRLNFIMLMGTNTQTRTITEQTDSDFH